MVGPTLYVVDEAMGKLGEDGGSGVGRLWINGEAVRAGARSEAPCRVRRVALVGISFAEEKNRLPLAVVERGRRGGWWGCARQA
jgi:hypothetical protein